jgi:2-keto-4-pentenoate hydratase/2-oxohepta-3-ene-1,7-dioic acid hydratase in catechol pathway
MKIAQFYENNRIRLGLINGEALVPLDFEGDMVDFIKGNRVCEPCNQPIDLKQVRFAPVVTRPTKIIAIGLNYLDHIRESNGRVPEIPIVFAKFPNSLIGHRGQIVWDGLLTKKVDFEAELAVIMGEKAYHCNESDVMGMVFGYACANDVSARDIQFSDKQWVRGKSLDTFCPIGPWIVTHNEISNPHGLYIKCWLNNVIMQDGNTDQMIFKLPQLISFLSRNFTLLPGDIILTGTPSGVGAFREPSVYLKDGDEVAIEIERIGRLVNTCNVMG